MWLICSRNKAINFISTSKPLFGDSSPAKKKTLDIYLALGFTQIDKISLILGLNFATRPRTKMTQCNMDLGKPRKQGWLRSYFFILYQRDSIFDRRGLISDDNGQCTKKREMTQSTSSASLPETCDTCTACIEWGEKELYCSAHDKIQYRTGDNEILL